MGSNLTCTVYITVQIIKSKLIPGWLVGPVGWQEKFLVSKRKVKDNIKTITENEDIFIKDLTEADRIALAAKSTAKTNSQCLRKIKIEMNVVKETFDCPFCDKSFQTAWKQ